jgi:hypothetical protein
MARATPMRRRKTHQIEQLIDARLALVARPAEQARSDRSVLCDGHVRKEPDALEDVADAAAEQDRIEAADVVALEAHRAFARRR